MKSYNSNEILNWKQLKKHKYLESSDSLGDGSQIGWKLIEKFPIDKIKHDANTYQNSLNLNEVINIINEFYPFAYQPIRLNYNHELVDGQHRLKVAELCGFEFIDVFIDNKMESRIDN